YVNDDAQTGDVFTTSVGNDLNPGTAAFPFRTIQHAIDVAADGNKIWVDAGTYDENVEVNKEVEIEGAGQALTFVIPATSNPSAGGSLGSAIFYIQADNVTIHDLTADGKNPGITLAADVDASTGIITDWTSGGGDWTNLEV